MIEIENTEVVGWEHAIRGMRNPLESWSRSDSLPCDEVKCKDCVTDERCNTDHDNYYIGTNDLDLMRRLERAGTDHRKFMRMIVVYCDITAPLYWWKEFDTYKVGTVANSCSTMHTIHKERFFVDNFSREYIWDDVNFEHPATQLIETEDNPVYLKDTDIFIYTVAMLNELRELYLKTKDKRYWYKMIQLLPSSYNQKRTVMLNYEVLANMYKSRRLHKLDEWREFCAWAEGLPYFYKLVANGKNGTDEEESNA